MEDGAGVSPWVQMVQKKGLITVQLHEDPMTSTAPNCGLPPFRAYPQAWNRHEQWPC